MHFPINFLIIPAITIFVVVLGARWSKQGAVSDWYKGLSKPKWTPKGSTIGEIWIFLYIFTTLAFMWYWNVPVFSWLHYIVGGLMLGNAALNAYWNKLFFVNHNIAKAFKEMKLMNVLAIVATLIMVFQSPIAAIGMLPYIVWVGIATLITREVLKGKK